MIHKRNSGFYRMRHAVAIFPMEQQLQIRCKSQRQAQSCNVGHRGQPKQIARKLKCRWVVGKRAQGFRAEPIMASQGLMLSAQERREALLVCLIEAIEISLFERHVGAESGTRPACQM